MRIGFLGSGGAFVDFRVNYQNNGVVETAEGPVLIDCGVTALQSLREFGLTPWSVRAILFTHLHSDHASPEALVGCRFYTGPNGGPARQRTEFIAPPDVLAPLGRSIEPYIDEYEDDLGIVRSGGREALVVLRATSETEVGGVRFRFFRVPHVVGPTVDKPAYGIEIDDGKTRVFWSGDTTISPAWIASAVDQKRTARVFHDCTFAKREQGTEVHTHFDDLRALPASLRSRITLMHHTAVPEHADMDGMAGAASRHQWFDLRGD